MSLTLHPVALAVLAGVVLSGCAPLVPELPAPLPVPRATTAAAPQADASARAGTRVTPGPKAPEVEGPRLAVEAPAAQPADETMAAVHLQQVALPTFIQVVYADVLKKNVSVDPTVTARPDLVTFKTGPGQTAAQIETAVRMLLKSYGLSVVEVAGLVRVVPDNASQGDLPGIRFGAAMPEVPPSLRPVFQLIPLEAVRQVDVTGWLRTLFGDRIKVQEDSTRNAVLISGNPDNVKAAVEALMVLDQPTLKGRTSLTLTPAFWSADELARRLAEVLSAEGYAVHPVGSQVTSGGVRSPIILLPVSSLNQVFVFAAGEKVASHVAEWARSLDRPNERGVGKNMFTYAVKHKDAEQLAGTLERVLGGTGSNAAAAAAAAGGTATAATNRSSNVVVDKASNTLIFQVNPEEFGQISALLQSLDKPTKSALIEVTVAELKLEDGAQVGVQWLTSHLEAKGGYTASASSGSGSTGGLNIQVLNGLKTPRVAIDALASNSRATILSSPRLMARNGETATIQVGDEVPVLSQQLGTTSTSGGTTGNLLATYQYRSTGVILKIKPVIHSGDQIDIDLSQEVSQPVQTTAGNTTMPTISTRKVESKLTLRNGSTMLLAGLIDGTSSDGNGGVPVLKDIPLLGSLFRNQTVKKSRREMIILITPYIANDSTEAEAITDSFRKALGDWARTTVPAPGAAASAPKP
ncbi:secretin N-terminal domain-containing protein [Pelomonas baiyunensis]|uniref:Secretin N-terminal domain-containing protein n=1 Tax=Pelomonas baiyunensis TaxID=3299026 RepID=A0ABW7H388_9BURK